MIQTRLYVLGSLLTLCLHGLLAGCASAPATRSNGAGLPIPPGLEKTNGKSAGVPASQPIASRYLTPGQTQLDLAPMKVIHLAFERSPKIRAAYLKYAAEKARYDYIVATWTSTTPGVAIGPGWSRTEGPANTTVNTHKQRLEGFVERNFLDTSRVRAFAGAVNEDNDDSHAFHPTAGGLLRFPLWGSRESLQRTSNLIFQQTRVNDAQLDYIEEVREQLADITSTFFAVMGIGERVEARQRQIDDLRTVRDRAEKAGKPAADLQRIDAELITATTQLRDQQCNYLIEKTWMTSTMGLPRDVEVRLVDGPFDPFGEASQDELMALSMQADPEIATLQNAIKDAEVQLALARKGRLDVAVLLGAAADLRGSGQWTGRTQYQANATVSVAFIDPRLSTSLAREAGANIWQYQHAIQRRRNNVYVDSMEPFIKLRMLARNIPDRLQNVQRYRQDFATAVEGYFTSTMDIDDLIRRRLDLFNEEVELSHNKGEVGSRRASLAAATGKFFELLAESAATQPAASLPNSQPASAPASQPVVSLKQETGP